MRIPLTHHRNKPVRGTYISDAGGCWLRQRNACPHACPIAHPDLRAPAAAAASAHARRTAVFLPEQRTGCHRGAEERVKAQHLPSSRPNQLLSDMTTTSDECINLDRQYTQVEGDWMW
ncbi:hypothetical protein DPEC_G00243370 [Dallia pectoralis]|uniref:Uncharacterized protein n=1 Tax=Dallia pectoralis TaxID=75939 RepID=A0ACC2FVA3_DALPE|nr:hypothetical protein DPEC_G00243370 [Dallia pectoralis]